MEAPVAFGPEAIQAAVAKSNFAGCRFAIQNIDCLPSLNGGILVNVLGKMQSKTAQPRAFAQTFFLAEQPSGYFILNDNLRFLAEAVAEESGETPSAIEKVSEPAPVASEKVEKTAPVSAPPAVEQSVQETPKETTSTAAKETAPVTETSKPAKKATPKPAKQVEKPVEEELPPSGPSSWAQLAAVQQSKWASGVVAPAKGTSIVESKPTAPSSSKPRQTESKPRNTTTSNANANEVKKSSTPSQSTTTPPQQQQQQPKKIPFVPEASLYVTGVTDALKSEDIKSVFSALGSLAHFDVNRRSGAAFVEYEDAGIAKLVLGQGSVSVNGVTLTVEKRRVNAGGRRDSHHNNNNANHDQGNKKFTPTNNQGKRHAPKPTAN